MVKESKLSVLYIGIYLVVFFAVWSVRELYIRPVFLDCLDGIAFGLAESAMKLLVWTLPAILLIKHFHDDMWIGLKEMFANKPIRFKDAYILLIVFVPLVSAVISGDFGIRSDFVPSAFISSVLFVGITEELVFRGFLLNAFLKKMKMPYAIALDAVLFTLIHYPIWIYRGLTISEFLSGNVVVPMLSVLFAYSFIKTKNILVPITLHMLWNLQVGLFG